MNRQLRTILIVDDQNDSRIMIKVFLSNFGYTVDTARNAAEALSLFDAKLHDLVVTDNSMPGMSGHEMAHVMKLRSPSTPILMYTGLIPGNQSCLDMVIERPSHLLAVKEAVDKLLGIQDQASTQ
jgi:CheY-like chemotaxis protein